MAKASADEPLDDVEGVEVAGGEAEGAEDAGCLRASMASAMAKEPVLEAPMPVRLRIDLPTPEGMILPTLRHRRKLTRHERG